MPRRLPGASDRYTVIGRTGDGKTVLGGCILAKQRFDKRPWVCLDFKNEELWDMVGTPPMKELRLGDMPGKRGLYRMRVNPWDDEALDAWLQRVWSKGNIGLFIDEVSLIKSRGVFKAILRQGRSLRIPVISCTQRPVDCDREVFSEAQYISVFGLNDERDYITIRGFTNKAPVQQPLPPFWSYWIDVKARTCDVLRPCPPPDIVAKSLRDVAPYSAFWG